MTKKKVRKVKAGGNARAVKAAPSTAGDAAAGSSASASSRKREVLKQEPVGKIALFRQFLSDVRAEFDKITWASRKETISLTIAVLAITIFFSCYLGLVDISLSKLVGMLIG